MYTIRRLQLTSSPPCWMTINKRILISFIVPAIQHGRQGLCHLNLTGMVANHLLLRNNKYRSPCSFKRKRTFISLSSLA